MSFYFFLRTFFDVDGELGGFLEREGLDERLRRDGSARKHRGGERTGTLIRTHIKHRGGERTGTLIRTHIKHRGGERTGTLIRTHIKHSITTHINVYTTTNHIEIIHNKP